MKIVHLCLSCFYIDGYSYQENELVRHHVKDGHEVFVVASTEVFDENGCINYVNPQNYMGADGAPVIRLPYRSIFPFTLARKVRAYPGVYNILSDLAPEVIFFHGPAAWELLTISRYVRDHPEVILHIDSHADAVNSAQGWASRHLLHGQFYRRILARAMQVSGPLLCVAQSVMEFAHEVYRVPQDRIEFFPLGGTVLSDAEREARRISTRNKLKVTPDTKLIVQSGKQGRSKKLVQTLNAFSRVQNSNLRLAISGVLQDDIRDQAEELIRNDSRIVFLGWQSADQLTDLLCAADVYLQPGTQSSTMQHALCCGCAVILADIPSHIPYQQGNGWFIDNESSLREALQAIPVADIEAMRSRSLEFAKRTLDYSKMATRILGHLEK